MWFLWSFDHNPLKLITILAFFFQFNRVWQRPLCQIFFKSNQCLSKRTVSKFWRCIDFILFFHYFLVPNLENTVSIIKYSHKTGYNIKKMATNLMSLMCFIGHLHLFIIILHLTVNIYFWLNKKYECICSISVECKQKVSSFLLKYRKLFNAKPLHDPDLV